jgi:hypothetical protein
MWLRRLLINAVRAAGCFSLVRRRGNRGRSKARDPSWASASCGIALVGGDRWPGWLSAPSSTSPGHTSAISRNIQHKPIFDIHEWSGDCSGSSGGLLPDLADRGIESLGSPAGSRELADVHLLDGLAHHHLRHGGRETALELERAWNRRVRGHFHGGDHAIRQRCPHRDERGLVPILSGRGIDAVRIAVTLGQRGGAACPGSGRRLFRPQSRILKASGRSGSWSSVSSCFPWSCGLPFAQVKSSPSRSADA